jgi:regulatory protein
MSDERFSDPIEARKKAMDYLARREHGRAELLIKLEKAGYDPEVCEQAIARLIEDGLQSDSRFVATFVQSRINQGKGPIRIRAELRDRQMGASVIEEGLASPEQDWYSLAGAVRRRKFGAERPTEYKDKAKQMRFLQYRGFESDHIQRAVSMDSD